MALETGTRVGRYEVLEKSGGSGVRFNATDTERRIAVTLTVVPPSLVDGVSGDRLRETAQTLSSLGHAGICVPLDFGQQPPDIGFIVTERVEGPTLAERLARGPMDATEALSIAIAVAEALDQAHRRGIVHRQLSPAAIVVAAGGPKILDFGVAASAPEADVSGVVSVMVTRTSTSGLATIPPAVARYLAPEQLEGKPADARADIFALGAILYEMVAGKPAFDEKTYALLVAAVQTVDPEPISKLAKVPPAFEHVIARALAKDPRQRLQTAWDLLVQLRWIADGGSQIAAAPVVAARPKRRVLMWAAAAIGLLAIAAAAPAAWARFSRAPERDVVRFTVSGMPPAAAVPVTISPDGRWLIGSQGGAGSRGVVALSLDSVVTQRLLTASTITQAFWSPDGRSVAFFDDGHLKRADIAGGPAQNICETALPIGGGTWNRDGVILFSAGGLVYRVLAAGGQPVALTSLDKANAETEHAAPSFLPDGRHYIYLAVGRESGIYVASIDSPGRQRLLAADSRAVYAAPGYILFNRQGAVFAQPFDANSLKLTGEPLRVVDGVGTLAQGPSASPTMTRTANFTVSQNGILAFKSTGATSGSADEQRTLMWYDRSGAIAGQAPGTGMYVGMDFAPDGRRFVVHRHEGTGGDIWSYDFEAKRFQRLTFDGSQENSSPVWSPDGTRIAFASRRGGNWGLYVKRADGTGAEELITESPAAKAAMSWSPDGKFIVYNQTADIWAVPLDGDKKPVALVATGATEVLPQVSPDGKWLAYQSNETGRAEIYVKPFPSGPGRWQISTDGGIWPRWRADGGEIYFVAAPNIVAASIKVTGNSIEAGTPVPVLTLGADPSVGSHETSYHRFAVSKDGSRFLLGQPAGVSTSTGGISDRIATLADGTGGTADGPASNLTVVVNWPRLLKRN